MHETAAVDFFGFAEKVAFGVEEVDEAVRVAFDEALTDAFVAAGVTECVVAEWLAVADAIGLASAGPGGGEDDGDDTFALAPQAATVRTAVATQAVVTRTGRTRATLLRILVPTAAQP